MRRAFGTMSRMGPMGLIGRIGEAMSEHPKNTAVAWVGLVRIVAHTQVQFDVFLWNHRIPKNKVRRVMSVRDVESVRPDSPLVLLPGWQESRESAEIFAAWRHRGGSVLNITEDCVLGQRSLCENDTNGDGDCHLCARKGGCFWPNVNMPSPEGLKS